MKLIVDFKTERSLTPGEEATIEGRLASVLQKEIAAIKPQNVPLVMIEVTRQSDSHPDPWFTARSTTELYAGEGGAPNPMRGEELKANTIAGLEHVLALLRSPETAIASASSTSARNTDDDPFEFTSFSIDVTIEGSHPTSTEG